MSYYWDKTLGQSPDKWDFSRWLPDAVIIYLGSNDYMTHVKEKKFLDAYWSLMRQITDSYKYNVTLISICGGNW